MNGLIRASLRNPIAVTVMMLALVVLGGLAAVVDPDRHPAGLQEPGGADPGLLQRDAGRQHREEHHRTARARGGPGLGRAAARVAVDRGHQHRPRLLPQQRRPQRCARPRSTRSPAGNTRRCRRARLPPVVLPYDPTSATPVCLVALDSATQSEATLFDVGRYEVRPQIMSQPGAIAPLVYGGKVRAIMMYLDRVKLQARHLSPLDVMKAVDDYNVFLPAGSAKFGTTDYAIDSNSMFDLVGAHGRDPAAQRARQRRVPARRGDPQGRQLHPDQRRAGQRQAPGLRPGLPPARRQHAPGRRHPQGSDRDDEGPADPARAST